MHQEPGTSNFDVLAHQSYLNIETFRKNGLGVKTPIWFVLDCETVYINTGAESGKVKRIHHNGQVNIAPCKMDGQLLGEWIPATARVVEESEVSKKVNRLLDKKYGLMKNIFGLFSPRKGKNSILEIGLQA